MHMEKFHRAGTTIKRKFAGVLKWTETTARVLLAKRLNLGQGANVASGSTITLGTDGNVFPITGTTTINYITTTNWSAGAIVTLTFSTSLTVTHNAGSVPANTAAILLSGAANLSATANDSVTLLFNGTTWQEIARTVI